MIDQTQVWLMLFASFIIVSLGFILTLAPAVRLHAGSERYQFSHWSGVFVWIVSFWLLHLQTEQKLPKRDPFLLPIIALLTGIGLIMIWRLYPYLGKRQATWIGVSSLVVLFGLNYPAYLIYLKRYKYIWLILGLLLTGLTIVTGPHSIGSSSNRWLELFGLNLQPSEPLKLLLIIYLAGYFTDQKHFIERKANSIFPTIIIISLALILLVFQRDLGTATIFLLIYLALLFSTQGNKKIFWVTPVLLVAAGIIGYLFVDVVQLRINTWLNPFIDPQGASYQIIQSLIAIAEGGLFGTGLGLGSPLLIPVSASDFIFSSISEELGLLGVSAIILLIIIFLSRGIKIAKTTPQSFNRYLTLGLVFYFGIQSLLIIGGNIGLLPLTGVPLPFLSAGGSSLLVSFCGFLFLLTISSQTGESHGIEVIQHPRFSFVGSFILGLLILEIFVTSFHAFWFKTALVNRPENPRWVIDDLYSRRGDILDRNNQKIITNTGEVGAFQRINLHTPLYPVIGYSHPFYGQTGIESSMFNYLRGKAGYPYKTLFWYDLLFNQPPDGLDVRLTIDLGLQKQADELMSGQLGAVIIMNASTGEILAMASSPYFDAAEFETNWETLVNHPDAPLVNRATQGLYPPGTTLFPFILAAQPNLIQQAPNPGRYFQLDSNNLSCAFSIEGDITWSNLISNGCEKGQHALINSIDAQIIMGLFDNLGFFTSPKLHLPTAEIPIPNLTDPAILPTANNTMLISPLQMAIAASSFSNEGVVPGARIVSAVQDPLDGWNTLPKLQGNVNGMPASTAEKINNLLQAADLPYWQIVSDSKTTDGESISWFVAGTVTEWQGQPTIAVVVIENNTPDAAQTIGHTLIENSIRLNSQ